MPVRTRAKAAARGRPQRLPTQFGELETTPTSRHHHQDDPTPIMPSRASPPAPPSLDRPPTQPGQDVFGDDFDDLDLIAFGDTQATTSEIRRRNSIQWSETESLARRSSPLCPDEAPSADWQFDEDDSLPPLSTPRSGGDHLPDTMPLPDSQQEDGPSVSASKKIDFSETASTMRRSSPVGKEAAQHALGFFDDASPDPDFLLTSPENHGVGPAQTPPHNTSHLPLDNIYDVTPPPANQQAADPRPTANAARRRGAFQPARKQLGLRTSQEGTGAQPRSTDAKALACRASEHSEKEPDLHQEAGLANISRTKETAESAEGSTNLTTGVTQAKDDADQADKGKKRKQRPKPPLQFDEASRVKETQTRPPAHATQKPRMPLVGALRDSAQLSSSPNVVLRKRGAANNKQPRAKKAKVAPAAAQKPKKTTAAKRQAPGKQQTAKAERPLRKNNASASAQPTVADTIVVSSEAEADFAKSPSSNDDEDPLFLPQITTPPPRRVEYSEPLATASSPHHMIKAIVDVDWSDNVQAVAAETSRKGEDATHRKLLDSRDETKRLAGAQKRRLSATSPPSTGVVGPERKMSRQGGNQGRPARRASRNYSVSVNGSPLPANHVGSDHEAAAPAEATSSIKDCPPPKFLNQSQMKAAAAEITSWRKDWLQRLRTADDEARRPKQQQETATAPLQGVPGDVRAQILASLREHDEGNRRRQGATRSGQDGHGHDGDDGQADERGGLPDNLSQQLHQVVNTMLRHLKSKEEAGHKVAETYRRNTSGCIEKIGSRQKQERRALTEAMRLDGDQFGQVVRKARSVVKRDSLSRAAGMRELEQKTAERQATYERAMESLRGLHRQLLQGSGDSGKQG
ncbi:hypothetical protein CDD80_3544 [Ophiocordyceps camponoti-rufipedis]|uniref:Uncharacterized protein n=1 Tax=Ophiocordyceps camponoti-rufipedis TaxID=2004952 RepID=A0A2C5Z3R9_9HYPO|nr:hypothetical protein CDD80_3544 [Ophiocordyceps camponoti-rufipedis]